MTQEEIKEYNKLCAEFLGMYDYSKDNEYFEEGKSFCYPEKDKNPECGFFTIGTKFNDDWNWIIELWSKIKTTKEIKPVGDTTQRTLREEIRYAVGNVDKEAVVQAINKFIIWYNENNKYENNK